MKKWILSVCMIIFAFGCSTHPDTKNSHSDSYLRLVRTEKIKCSFTRGGALGLNQDGKLVFEKDDLLHAEPDSPFDLLVDVQHGSDMAYIKRLDDDPEANEYYPSRIEKWGGGISFVVIDNTVGEEIGGIAFLNISDDYVGDTEEYKSYLSINFNFLGYRVYDYSGFCTVLI